MLLKFSFWMEKKNSLALCGGCLGSWREDLQSLILKGNIPIDCLNPLSEEKRPSSEYWAIDNADIYCLWFPAVGTCSGSLIELGRFLAQSEKPLVVGVDPKSTLLNEVVLHCKHLKGIEVCSSLEEVCEKLKIIVHE
jgi:hypothetical protein